jgi:transposase
MLTDAQWKIVQPLLPEPPPSGHRGRPPLDQRLILDAILWKLITRQPWRALSSSVASHQVCYLYYRRWRDDGSLEKIYRALINDLRTRGGFDPRQAIDKKYVKFFKYRGRMEVYLPASFALSWQAATAMLYFRCMVAFTEVKLGLSTQSDPLLEIFISQTRRIRSSAAGASDGGS